MTVEQISIFKVFKETAKLGCLKSGKHERTERTEKGLRISLGCPRSSLLPQRRKYFVMFLFFFRTLPPSSICMDFSSVLML